LITIFCSPIGVVMVVVILSGNSVAIVWPNDMDCPPILTSSVVSDLIDLILAPLPPMIPAVRANNLPPASMASGVRASFGVLSAGAGMLMSISLTSPNEATGRSKSSALPTTSSASWSGWMYFLATRATSSPVTFSMLPLYFSM
jgi:hypothetical protein